MSEDNEDMIATTTMRSEATISVHLWDTNQVHAWLVESGFQEYAGLLAHDHQVDGAALLQLDESDLRLPPLSLTKIGDIKRLGAAIKSLQSANRSPQNFVGSLDVHATHATVLRNGVGAIETVNLHEEWDGELVLSSETIIRHVESPDTPAKTLLKMAIGFLYCSMSLLVTALVMVVVHDRVPDMKTYPPLPDLVLDNLPLIPGAFELAELIGIILSTIWFSVLVCHRHRLIAARRMFSITGSVFLLRCVTMLITSLSVPGVHLECRAKSHGTVFEKLQEAYHIWSRLGMSIHGVRSCGDYMFSGHTTAITLLNHFITEYTPPSWSGLHTCTWVMNVFGIFFILAGHEHYSIDVFVAFYISSRMFLYYHAYAYNQSNLTATDSRVRFWFPLGWFFEAGSLGRVPNEFEWPFRWRLMVSYYRRLRGQPPLPSNGGFSRPSSTVPSSLPPPSSVSHRPIVSQHSSARQRKTNGVKKRD